MSPSYRLFRMRFAVSLGTVNIFSGALGYGKGGRIDRKKNGKQSVGRGRSDGGTGPLPRWHRVWSSAVRVVDVDATTPNDHDAEVSVILVSLRVCNREKVSCRERVNGKGGQRAEFGGVVGLRREYLLRGPANSLDRWTWLNRAISTAVL